MAYFIVGYFVHILLCVMQGWTRTGLGLDSVSTPQCRGLVVVLIQSDIGHDSVSV